jgi:hypothetical protein
MARHTNGKTALALLLLPPQQTLLVLLALLLLLLLQVHRLQQAQRYDARRVHGGH